MTGFDSTRAPRGRLCRLGVLVDEGQPDDRVGVLARLCDRAGIDVVWVSAGLDDARPPAWPQELRAARAGIVLATDGPVPDDVSVARFATTRTSLDVQVPADRRQTVRLQALRAGIAAGGDVAQMMRLSAIVEDLTTLPAILSLVDDVVLPGWAHVDLETAADEVRAASGEQGRDPSTLGVAVLVPVSIGRTEAEAAARASMDPAFGRYGSPAEVGIFGALEECQDRVIALAHAGVTDLRCILPATPDIHDVVAQLTAMTMGTTDVLLPGSLRSPAPPPPEGWGGRPDRPPGQRISGGSRRR